MCSKALLDHFSVLSDPRQVWKAVYPLPEILTVILCATLAGAEDFVEIERWAQQKLAFLRRLLPFEDGIASHDTLNDVMNALASDLFGECFTTWVESLRESEPDFVAIDGKTSRRSHDRSADKAPLHLVSAFATTARLVLGQEAVADKSSETTAIPILLERLARDGGLEGALVSIDAIATNATIATAIGNADADYLLAVKANQPTIRGEIEAYFAEAPASCLDTFEDLDKAHGRIEQRTVTVSRETDWLNGTCRFPGELRLPAAASIVRVAAKAELKDRYRIETRYYISSATLSPRTTSRTRRAQSLGDRELTTLDLDVTFKDDQSRLRKGHGANNMAIVRHIAINLVRAVTDKKSIKLRRKRAGWNTKYLQTLLGTLDR